MEFSAPLKNGFTVYSKSGCYNCINVKTLLAESKYDFVVIDCDEYLIDSKEDFLSFIREKANKEHRTFPMVFKDGKFVGGFTETQQFVYKDSCFDDDDF